ncbi:type II toxin-antitoxin system mRNA interferase toxin, RelE/StbE family [Candidatus Parcubacteria bacterium]|nr:type II toxin-antitoxin system mRNA interferase toxin, RelE/StbE family [Candidatus Parcubacteria bacterium]
MKIVYHKTFRKHFKERVVSQKKLQSRFYQRLNLLIKNPNSPVLRKHQLKGKKKVYWSFSVTGDIRVIYKMEKSILFLYDIGTHEQVY